MAKKEYGKKLLSSVPVYDNVPHGWSVIIGATTAPKGYVWVSNNKSHFGGERKQALVKIKKNKCEV